MCRLAAYIGPEIALHRFLLEPGHSLYRQSWEPRELTVAKLNADGFGFGWYGQDGQPALYINPMPIWSDSNLSDLARSLVSDLWVANVRSATPGLASGPANTQPFAHGDVIFTHNGYVEDFPLGLRGHIRLFLSPETEAGIHGNTDSEYVFALIRQLQSINEEMDLAEAMTQALSHVEHWLDNQKALLNLLLTDGERLYATRHSLNGDSPSLYYTVDDEHFPEGAQLIASEPLTDADYWQPVPDHHLLILDREQPPELVAL